MLRPGQGGEVALQRLLVEAGIAGGDVVVPLWRHAGVIDDEAGAVLLAAEREADDRVHAGIPFRRVRGAESPCLHDALARDKLDLTALDPTAEEAECLTLAVAQLRRPTGGRGELLAVGQHLVNGLGSGGDDGFLVNEHGCSFVWQAGCQLCLRDERRCRRRTRRAMKPPMVDTCCSTCHPSNEVRSAMSEN